MNELQVFSYEGKEVRTVQRDGEPWWVAKDVCDVFGETNRNRAMQALDADEKGYTQMTTPGGVQNASIVSEAGLYALLFSMQPSKARGVSDTHIAQREDALRKFKRWVTHEVLPSIRKHGAYMTPNKLEEVLLDPDTLIRLATDLKNERRKRLELEANAAADRPKVFFANSVETSHTSVLIGDLAKLLKQNGMDIGQNRLFKLLRAEGYLCGHKGDQYNSPTQRSMEMGLFAVRERTINNPDGSVRITRTTKVTGKGQIYFINKYCGLAS